MSEDEFEIPDDLAGLEFDAHGRLVDVTRMRPVIPEGPPPPVKWVCVLDVPSVLHRGVWMRGEEGTVHDYRASSDVYHDAEGAHINVVSQWDWMRWFHTPEDERPPTVPRSVCWPAERVWLLVQGGADVGEQLDDK